MSKDSILDYLSYILFRVIGFLIRRIPKTIGLFLGRKLGDLLYYLDAKHRAIAYSNIKTALGPETSPCILRKLCREFYRSFIQNLFEIFYIPQINKKYLNKYVTLEGFNNIAEAFKKGKGAILLAVHEGSWELSNIISSNLGFPFSLFVREQARYKRLEELLNLYRRKKGCKLIERENQLKELISVLKNNEAIGMTIDQGGKTGIPVKFFGKEASMATGAVKLALKYGTAILPVFFVRLGGPRIKIIIGSPFEVKKTQDPQQDLVDNVQGLVHIFEKYILRYPQEYLWTYKIWKYGKERLVLVLGDGKAGHLRQSQALAKITAGCLKEKAMSCQVRTAEIKFKSNLSKKLFMLASAFSGKYQCQGCLWCLKTFLDKNSYASVAGIKPDIIISCGAAMAPVNYVLARENSSKSIVIMTPQFPSLKRFNLAVIPKHDHPPKRKNVVVTEGSLNLVDDDYLKEEAEKLIKSQGAKLSATGRYIGLLIGGDTKGFCLEKEDVRMAISQIKSAAGKINAGILATTSRRTTKETEAIVREELGKDSGCKFLVIANEENFSFSVGGILGLSQIVVTSAESISMISEAVNSKKYVLVFESEGLSRKHKRFLSDLAGNKLIYLVKPGELASAIERIWQEQPAVSLLKDNLAVAEAIKNIL